MRTSELAAIRPHLERAVADIDYYLTGLEERGKARRELSELYDLMAAGKTPPEVMGQGKPIQLTEKQKEALAGIRPRSSQLIKEEQAEALAALPGEPISDAEWAAIQFALRGGWRESSHQAAAWLRNAGETVAANGIDVALRPLVNEPRDAGERSDYREAMRTAAEYVKTILVTCIEEQSPFVKSADVSADRPTSDESVAVEVAAKKPDSSSPKPSTNARMLDLLGRRPEAADWSAKQFAEALGVSKSTIAATDTWKRIMQSRKTRAVERFEEQTERDETGKRQHKL